MCIEKMLERYLNKEINADYILEYLKLKDKIKNRFPLIEYDLYKELLEYILKKCIDNYDYKEDFIKYYFKEIGIVLVDANKHEELKLANNYLSNVFKTNITEVRIIIKEINDFITFLMCNNVFINYEFIENLFAENKNILKVIEEVFQKNNITYNYINKIITNNNIL